MERSTTKTRGSTRRKTMGQTPTFPNSLHSTAIRAHSAGGTVLAIAHCGQMMTLQRDGQTTS